MHLSQERKVLTLVRAAAFGRTPKELATYRVVEDPLADDLVHRLETVVLAEHVHDQQFVSEPVRVPATWWQHWKRDHAPRWAQRRWPVRYQTFTLTVDLTRWIKYPWADIPVYPDRLGKPIIFDQLDSSTASTITDL